MRGFEGLGRVDPAALDVPGRRLDRQEFGLVYESRSGLIALLHRLRLEDHKPEVISRKLDPKTQKAFIASYEDLLNSKGDDEVVIFVDAAHPTHAARPVGCWAPKEHKLAIEQTSGRERINIHGAIDLETGQTRMIEAETIDALSTIRLPELLESPNPLMVCIHVFLDNARYHHAKLVKEWLARPSCRIKLHFLPTYRPHLNPIERLWGVMHKNITHNKCYGTCGEFAETTLEFLRVRCPEGGPIFCGLVTDNFRIISPKDFGSWVSVRFSFHDGLGETTISNTYLYVYLLVPVPYAQQCGRDARRGRRRRPHQRSHLGENAGDQPQRRLSRLQVRDTSIRRAGGGSIINTASLVALMGARAQIAYTASKGGVLALSRELAIIHAGEVHRRAAGPAPHGAVDELPQHTGEKINAQGRFFNLAPTPMMFPPMTLPLSG